MSLKTKTRITGRIIDRHGQPAAGAAWAVCYQAGAVATAIQRNRMAEGRTDGEGKFTALVDPLSTAWVTAELDGWRGRSDPRPLQAEQNDAGTVRLDGPILALRLAVTDPAGDPVAGATILLQRLDGSNPSQSARYPEAWARSSENGQAVVRLDPGSWRTRASHEIFETKTLELELRPEDPGLSPSLSKTEAMQTVWIPLPLAALPGGPRTFEVRVVDPQGAPIADALLLALGRPEEVRVVPKAVRSDTDGRCQVEVHGTAGAVHVRVDHSDYVAEDRQLSVRDLDRELVVELRRGGHLWGEIAGVEPRQRRQLRVELVPERPVAVPQVTILPNFRPASPVIYRVTGVPLEGPDSRYDGITRPCPGTSAA